MARYLLLANGVRDTLLQIDLRRHQPGWGEYQQWLADGGMPDPMVVEQEPLAVRQERAWSRIREHRDNLKRLGVQIAGKWFHTDAASRIQQIGLVMMGQGVPAVQWKTMDGSFVQMTPALASGIFQAVAALDIAAFTAAETHKAAMLSAADPDTYDFSAGWPEVYTP